jgi:hypothetical protein
MTEREEELLNSRQVAVILDLSPDTVNEFARKRSRAGIFAMPRGASPGVGWGLWVI